MLVYAWRNAVARGLEFVTGGKTDSVAVGKREHGNNQENRSTFLLEYSILLWYRKMLIINTYICPKKT